NHVDKNGIISKVMIEIPDDQDEEDKEVSQEEFTANQPITRKDFIGVLNKTYNDINSMIAKFNEIDTKINNLENIIVEHNELLKKIVNKISK
ncbi:MAG TPA: hypothetical protein V6C58_07755, partial [Allocoleopsis sp.]